MIVADFRFYTYEDMTDSIVPYETMNEQLAELREIKTVSRASGDRYWFVGDRTVYLVKCAINTFDIELRIPYSLFDGLAVEAWLMTREIIIPIFA